MFFSLRDFNNYNHYLFGSYVIVVGFGAEVGEAEGEDGNADRKQLHERTEMLDSAVGIIYIYII